MGRASYRDCSSGKYCITQRDKTKAWWRGYDLGSGQIQFPKYARSRSVPSLRISQRVEPLKLLTGSGKKSPGPDPIISAYLLCRLLNKLDTDLLIYYLAV